MSDEARTEADGQVRELDDAMLDGVAGGGQGGKPGRCPGCGANTFESIAGGKIRCLECGWEGYASSIGLR